MLLLLGSVLSFLGGALVLIPNITSLFEFIHRIPPFSAIKEAEKTLYREKELTPEDPGFDRLVTAVMKSSQPYDSTSEYGHFREYGAEFPSPDGPVHIDYEDCEIIKIKKEDDDFLSDSVFALNMIPKERDDSIYSIRSVSEDQIPLIETEIPNGRFPDIVGEYKRSIVARWGGALLAGGLITNVVAIIL